MKTEVTLSQIGEEGGTGIVHPDIDLRPLLQRPPHKRSYGLFLRYVGRYGDSLTSGGSTKLNARL